MLPVIRKAVNKIPANLLKSRVNLTDVHMLLGITITRIRERNATLIGTFCDSHCPILSSDSLRVAQCTKRSESISARGCFRDSNPSFQVIIISLSSHEEQVQSKLNQRSLKQISTGKKNYYLKIQQ